MSADKKVAIIGSGLIGRNWAMIFTSFGYPVQLYDTNVELLAKSRDLIGEELKDMCSSGTARGSLSYEQRMALISTTESLADLLADVWHVQECVFDSLPLKQQVFKQVDELLSEKNELASLCSSSSVHMPSLIFCQVTKHRAQCLNAHPINPPLHVRLVELIPWPDTTRPEILQRVRSLMEEIGQKPVVLNKEISGFSLNRLQYAVFQEAYRLVHDGIMSPEDVDTVVSDGLGPRYAFMGPWMTAHLNASGLADYLDRYNEGIYSVSKECQPLLKFGGESATKLIDAMTKQVPIERLDAKRAWRNKCLTELAQIKDKLGDI